MSVVVREFTVAIFVVYEGKVLLHRHAKLDRWLPPGGHIEANELPDEAAVREVAEETGVRVRLVGGRGLPITTPRQLVIPAGIQLENIAPGHQHIDLVYFAVPLPGGDLIADEHRRQAAASWFEPAELADLGVDDEIRRWCERAIGEIAAGQSSVLHVPSDGDIL